MWDSVNWKSNQQPIVVFSNTEIEYITLTKAVKEGLWLKGMIEEFGISQKHITVYYDHQSAIHLPKHQVFHERSKHINVKMHFVRDVINKEDVKVMKIAMEDNTVDMLTKALLKTKFKKLFELS